MKEVQTNLRSRAWRALTALFHTEWNKAEKRYLWQTSLVSVVCPPHTLGLVSNQNISSCRKFSAQLYPQNATFQGWGCGASARELAQQAQGPEFKPQYCKEKKSKPCFNTQFTTHQLHPCLGVYPRIGQNANSELRWPLTPLNPNE
jgi:hypothetical protein